MLSRPVHGCSVELGPDIANFAQFYAHKACIACNRVEHCSPTPPIGPSRRHIKSAKGGGHERSSSDSASKISLSAESSSVTSLPGLRKGAGAAVAAAEPAAPPPKKPATKSSLSSSSSSLPKIPKAKIGRTTSRDRIRKERRPDDGEYVTKY